MTKDVRISLVSLECFINYNPSKTSWNMWGHISSCFQDVRQRWKGYRWVIRPTTCTKGKGIFSWPVVRGIWNGLEARSMQVYRACPKPFQLMGFLQGIIVLTERKMSNLSISWVDTTEWHDFKHQNDIHDSIPISTTSFCSSIPQIKWQLLRGMTVTCSRLQRLLSMFPVWGCFIESTVSCTLSTKFHDFMKMSGNLWMLRSGVFSRLHNVSNRAH